MTTTLRPLPAPGRRARSRAGLLAVLGVFLVCQAQAAIVYLTFGATTAVDPLTDPVSDYAQHRTSGPLFAASVVLVLGGGLLIVAATAGSPPVTTTNGAGPAQLVAVGGLVLAAAGLTAHGRLRCLVLASAAAVFFGTGSALIREASQVLLANGFTTNGLTLAAEAMLLMLIGGWLLHQAYAAGPAGVVVGATTVLDPLTAVGIGLGVFGESTQVSPFAVATQGFLALVAVAGVLALARSVPDHRDHQEQPVRPSTSPGSGLKILISADTFPPDINGAAHFAGRLAHGLADRGHPVHVVCPANTAHATTESTGGITVHRIPSRGTPFHPTFRVCTPRQATRSVPSLLDLVQPDLVHVQSHFSIGRAVLAGARERGIATVATNHFMPENLLGYVPLPHVLRGPLTRWAWRDLVRIYERADVVTAPTQRAVELLEANGLPVPAQAVSCGIDVEHYASPRPDGCYTDRSVLFVGRLDTEKNVDDLLRAVALLSGVRAEIIGDGACRARLVSLANSLGVRDRVQFHGFVSDEALVRAYQLCDVFCMPGTAELQSLATLEAMAAGRPIVAADAMALPHLVDPGVNGRLYPPGDFRQLAACLTDVLRDEETRAEMGRASRRMVAAHDIDRTLARFEDLYHAVTGAAVPSSALTA
ncbi:glycosyltransferase [Amycolatopsis sp. H20-H5]|uniref:glycosyltransferase n=1 Tax=Amycolatopsis sp. H20-H5 TaxID=3046309 RepID=UPI002DB8AEAF|nr:glycosyltransferase [Amycolatopsis sp. H20-H5]MEC3980564.1 glycosyltransferase [Amycolatopsis sp. H20-H5]